MIWWLLPCIIFLLWLLFKAKNIRDRNSILGRRFVIEYLDHNDDIKNNFPVTGTFTRMIKIKHTIFFVFKMEKSFHYANANQNELIIRSRKYGEIIGLVDEAEVHVLLPKIKLEGNNFHVDDFEQVAWAVVKKPD